MDGDGDPRASSYGPEYWLRRCEAFLVVTATKRIGRVVGIRYGRSQDQPEALAVRLGRFGQRVVLVSVDGIERIDAEARRIVVSDPPRLLSEEGSRDPEAPPA